ncbi:MAG: UDP-3-O-(3-hydroxymyristoyl)glucosamine N-acyltransferase [Bacillota bacterium]|nr:MAG: UDP-3-O-(3-hydroxymyristoyl)glucosamine N-acyltransferase [Bacillota bacterium]
MYTLGQLARLVGGELVGDPEQAVSGAAPVDVAGPDQITFAVDAKALERARQGQAGAVIVPRNAPDIGRPVIRVENPRLAFAKVLELFAPPQDVPVGVHPTAVISDGVILGEGTSVGAYAYIGPGTRIGANVRIYPGVYIGRDVEIGDDTVVYPNVVIMDRVQIGCRVILQPGSVIGSDSFGFVTVEGRHVRVPHIGTVVIEDDVEIGVNSAVARATCGTTRIGRGTKLDAFVYIAHNVKVGAHCLIVGMSAVAGSAELEDGVVLAGQTGVVGHLRVGAGSVVAARGLVAADLPPKSFVSGFPARPHVETMRVLAAQRRVPELLKTVAELEKRVQDLERRAAEFESRFPEAQAL